VADHLTTAHSTARWLGVAEQPRRNGRVTRRDRVGQLTLGMLSEHAPEIAALKPDAEWSAKAQDAIARDIAKLPEIDRRDVHNAVAHVIACGAFAGLWQHRPWPLRAVTSLLPSRIRAKDVDAARDAEQRRERLMARLPGFLDSSDPNILTGALIVAAADYSAILQSEFSRQLLNPSIPRETGGGLVWIDLRLGGADSPWRNVRRWFLDEASQLLATRLSELHMGLPDFRVSEKEAMRSVARALDLPEPNLSLPAVLRSARAWWGIHLPAFLHDYSLRPALALSLPATAWKRLVMNAPLRASEAPLPVRSLPKHEPSALEECNAAPTTKTGDAPASTPPSRDGFAHGLACADLMRALRPRRLEKKLSSRLLRERLHAWLQRHGHAGGWTQLLYAWVCETLFSHEGGAFRRGDGPRPPGLLRYLEGFAERFVAIFWRTPPNELDLDAWNTGLEALRTQLADMKSASVARTGLFSFLMFAEGFGVPAVVMGDSWASIAGPADADSNLLTPSEYMRLRQWLADVPGHAPGSYPDLRLQVMTVLAFRLGTRWEELQTLRLRDVVLTVDRERGSVWIRANEFAHGKVREATRTLSIEHFLSPEERALLGRYVFMARSLGGTQRLGSDLLFADPGALGLPPEASATHDVIQTGMRQVSGDPSLVFHHLRHSCGTFALLRLFADEAAACPAPYPWLPSWEVVSARAIVGSERSYASHLIGRGTDDPARLFAVAEMLGHLDPESSLLSYLHAMDILLHLATTKMFPMRIATAAAIDGIKPESVRRRRHRAKQATAPTGTPAC
jgi:integrase